MSLLLNPSLTVRRYYCCKVGILRAAGETALFETKSVKLLSKYCRLTYMQLMWMEKNIHFVNEVLIGDAFVYPIGLLLVLASTSHVPQSRTPNLHLPFPLSHATACLCTLPVLQLQDPKPRPSGKNTRRILKYLHIHINTLTHHAKKQTAT